MKISLPNFFYDLQAPQVFIYSKTDTGGTIPLSHTLTVLGLSTLINNTMPKAPIKYSKLMYL